MAKTDLTAQRLRELLHYDLETGMFTWLSDRGRTAKRGQQAGNISKSLGYVMLMIDQQNHYGHRLAFMYMTGAFPAGQVDHIDGIRSNNRYSNLRDVPQQINLQNRRAAQTNSQSGVLGVTRYRDGWRATVTLGRKQKSLGTYPTPELAHAAYLEGKRLLHTGNTL